MHCYISTIQHRFIDGPSIWTYGDMPVQQISHTYRAWSELLVNCAVGEVPKMKNQSAKVNSWRLSPLMSTLSRVQKPNDLSYCLRKHCDPSDAWPIYLDREQQHTRPRYLDAREHGYVVNFGS